MIGFEPEASASPLRVVHVSALDVAGGAARAAYRSHHALLSAGVDSHMLVQDGRSHEPRVHAPEGLLARARGRYLNVRLDRLPTRLYRHRDGQVFHPGWFGAGPGATGVPARLAALSPQVAHLHWVCNGFLRVEELSRLGVPLVWTLHDMWPFTGGCHYAGACDGFTQRCGHCPMLGSGLAWDLSRLGHYRRQRAYKRAHITLLSPSRWLAQQAHKSPLFRDARVEVIPNGVDLSRYRPRPRPEVRAELGLPIEAPLLLFGAVAATGEHRKGFDLLRAALARLDAHMASAPAVARLVVFGDAGSAADRVLGFPVHYTGPIDDEEHLAKLYAAADVFVLPSRQDNLPNTVVEALACGTPAVAFDVGGMPELIEPDLLAEPLSSDSLAACIARALSPAASDARRAEARARAVRDFDLSQHAERLIALYRSLPARYA